MQHQNLAVKGLTKTLNELAFRKSFCLLAVVTALSEEIRPYHHQEPVSEARRPRRIKAGLIAGSMSFLPGVVVTRSGIEGFNDGVNCSILFFGLSRGRPLYNSLQWAF